MVLGKMALAKIAKVRQKIKEKEMKWIGWKLRQEIGYLHITYAPEMVGRSGRTLISAHWQPMIHSIVRNVKWTIAYLGVKFHFLGNRQLRTNFTTEAAENSQKHTEY